MTLLAVLAALGFAAGVTLLYIGYSGGEPNAARPRKATRAPLLGSRDRRNALIGLAVGLGLALFGWVIAIVVAPIVAVVIPWLMRVDQGISPDDLEALEEWTRSLSGVIGAGQGISSAIIATRTSCPDRIRPQVERLIARLYSRRPLDQALYAFADDIDNQVGDFVATALIQASRHEGAALGKALDGIAVDVTEEVRARRDIETARAATRAQVRIVTAVVVVVMVVFVLFTPLGGHYRTPIGQIALVFVVGLFLGSLWWLKRAATTRPLARFLINPAAQQEAPR